MGQDQLGASAPVQKVASRNDRGACPAVWKTCAAAAAMHGLLAAFCVALARSGGDVATLWLANAPVVALLLLRPGHARFALPAVGVANALVNLAAGSAAEVAVVFVCGNLAAIAVAVALLRRAGTAAAGLRSITGLSRVLLLGVLVPEAAGASIAAALSSTLGGPAAWPTWSAWVQGGWIGGSVGLPLALLVAAAGASASGQSLRQWQVLTLLPLCIGVTLLALVHLPYPFVMLAIPLVGAAIVVDQLAHALLVAAVGLTATMAAAVGAFLAAPTQSHWEGMLVSLSLLAALLPAQLLAATLAHQRDHLAQLAAQADELRRANDGLEQFVRVASHDLREPLNTVVQFAQLLHEDAGPALPAASQRYLRLVLKAGTRMRSLLDDMLQYARLQREHLGEPAVVDLNGVLAEVRAALAGSLGASEAQLTVDSLPPVRGHAWLLQLMFQNLLGNAIKFVPPGVNPRVHVSARRADGRVFVTVADNGIGIAAEDQAQLFKPFSRLHLRRQYEGSGLGLSLVAQAAKAHGGEVALESAPGQGSRFTVTLPAAD